MRSRVPGIGNSGHRKHRPEQAGPPQVGTRENAAGLDLNRDFVKLETPEVRGLVRCFRDWNPAVVIDCHTTNGSHHRYTLTYEGGRCPAGDPQPIDFTREKLLPLASRKLGNIPSRACIAQHCRTPGSSRPETWFYQS